MIYSFILVQGLGWLQPVPTAQEPSGTQPWPGCRPITVHTHAHIHTPSDWDHWDTPTNLMCTVLTCGRNWSTQRKHMQTQTWGGLANSIQTVAPAGHQIFFINLIMKHCWIKQHYLRNCYMPLPNSARGISNRRKSLTMLTIVWFL